MKKYLIGLGLIALAPQVMAHTGDELTMMTAFFHPFTGMDHLAVMLVTGFLASQGTRSQAMKMLMTFVLLFAFGMLLGQFGLYIPMVEAAIACTVLAMGLVGLQWLQLRQAIVLPLLASTALLHGLAHGVLLAHLSLGASLAQMVSMLLAATLIICTGFLLSNNHLFNYYRLQQWLASGMLVLGASLLV